MDSDSISAIVGLIALILLSAYFSSAETAFTSANRIRLRTEADKGDKRAKQVLELSEDYDSLLSTILIGNNIVNIASSSIATLFFVSFFPTYGPAVATVVMTIAVLIFGEITPKIIARERSEDLSKLSAPFLRLLVVVLKPLTWLFGKWTSLITRYFKSTKSNLISEEELLSLVEEAELGGGLENHDHQLIRSAIEFNDLEVSSILTPRVDVIAADIDDSDEAIRKIFYEHNYSRILMYDDSIDNIYGFLHEKDFNRYMQKKMESEAELPILDCVKEIMFIPPVMKLTKVLKDMQQKKMHMAVVTDEYGGTIGIVTMEDVLEELVGEIWDESDIIEEEIVPLEDQSYQILGTTSLEKLFQLYSIDNDDVFISNSVSGFVIEQLGRVPEEGDTFTYENMTVTVVYVRNRRVLQVRVDYTPMEQNEELAIE
ncbi:HlyC/CorC family transporter [Atopococcus tabaci]|uniref:HlyC/CorC family transporter n=1 Tax=Atopococcus tabaci TaxID=269774 RepID=UPI00041CC7BC|nr:hemolysin family protein [Atopococcus tabaci]